MVEPMASKGQQKNMLTFPAAVTDATAADPREFTAVCKITEPMAVMEYLAIMGPSGSGKTTLMNIIGCLDVPTSGTYELDGKDLHNLSDNDLAEIRNKHIGFVFQGFHLMPKMDALENVALPLLYAGVSVKDRREKAERL